MNLTMDELHPRELKVENENLALEAIAINSIYGEDTLRPLNTTISSCPTIVTVTNGEKSRLKVMENLPYILHLPHHDVWLKLCFPITYPDPDPRIEDKERTGQMGVHCNKEKRGMPFVLGIHSCGPSIRKGDAARISALFESTLARVFRPGEVCLFDVMEELSLLPTPKMEPITTSSMGLDHLQSMNSTDTSPASLISPVSPPLPPPPIWSVSEVMRELKSVFVARSTYIKTLADVHRYRQVLLDGEKKVAAATHNIMAWRLRIPITDQNEYVSNIRTSHRTEEDYDDDGESAAGARLLHLMQLMDVWNVMVIVTRWYGGTNLGPRRFTLINSVARDALRKTTSSLNSPSTI